MRKFIIDTDTASDDVIAIITALREPSVEVLALTVVAGNVGLEQSIQNALTAIEIADTYQPSVYEGMSKPLFRNLFTADDIHGLMVLEICFYLNQTLKLNQNTQWMPSFV